MYVHTQAMYVHTSPQFKHGCSENCDELTMVEQHGKLLLTNCRGSAVKCGIHFAQLYNFFQLYVYCSTTENVIIMSSNKFSIE